MKTVDILRKAGLIENMYILIEEPTEDTWGCAIKLTGDPYLEIVKLTNHGDKRDRIKIDGEIYYRTSTSIVLDVGKVPLLLKSIKKLMEMEMGK